jgi:hypothetical protein
MFIRKTTRPVARVLLLVMLSECFSPLLTSVAHAEAPAADMLKGFVDPFSGDLRYGVPLLSVPGPNGENVPVTVGYSSGIRNEQEASWVGLGWNYNPGEIARETQGVPDDWSNVLLERDTFARATNGTVSTSTDDTRMYGPLYFKNYPDAELPESAMDIYQSERLMRGSLFEYPDYDAFYISGPGISGEMSAHLFEYGTLMNKDKGTEYGDLKTDPAYSFYNYTSKNKFSKRVEFLLKGELAARTWPGHYDNSSNWRLENTGEGQVFQSPELCNTCNYGGTDYMGSTKNRARASHYVKYFTNAEINSLSGTTPFLDYALVSGTRRPVNVFPNNGIGAFQVTTPSGMIYHYSLPVYGRNEGDAQIPLKDDFTVDPARDLIQSTKNGLYAMSWKLTAVTGSDYVDSNGNRIADKGDAGYWVAYSYGLWANDFTWRAPFYGSKYDAHSTVTPATYKTSRDKYARYTRQGSVAYGQSQLYYLNSIKTSTHCAYFIKETRYDAHSSAATPVPKLKLSRIVLMRNEEAAQLLEPGSGGEMPLNGFAASSFNAQNVTHTGNYNANKAAIDAASLKTIEFGYDYSLCPKIYNSIRNSFTTVPVQWNSIPVYREVTQSTYGTDNGKLTLKSITQQEKGYVKIFPDYLFAYGKNPDYTCNKEDYWGMYKSDFFNYADRGGYTSPSSKNEVDAWSLSKIITPIGSEIDIVYESDEYERVGYNGSQVSLGFPQRVFPVKAVQGTHTLEFYDDDVFRYLSAPRSYMSFLALFENPGCNLVENGPDYCNPNLFRSSLENHSEIEIPFFRSQIYTYDSQGVASAEEPERDAGTNFLIMPPTTFGFNKCYPGCTGAYSYDPAKRLGFALISPRTAYGGGVRVKSISVKETESGVVYRNTYAYREGIATTEPDRFAPPGNYGIRKSYFSGDRHSMAPMVGYTSVTCYTGDEQANSGRVEHIFRNYRESFVPFLSSSVHSTGLDDRIYQVIAVVEDNTLYGSLVSEKMYDIRGNIVSSVVNHYQGASTDQSGNAGTITEAFHRRSVSRRESGDRIHRNILSSAFVKRQTTSFLLRQEVYRNGLKTVTEYRRYDPVSGMPVSMSTNDPTRGFTETIVTPAYTLNSGMGSKADNELNHNRLSESEKQLTSYADADRDVYGNLVPVSPVVGDGSYTSWLSGHPYRRYDAGSGQYVTATLSLPASGGYWMPREMGVFNGSSGGVVNFKKTGTMTLFDSRYKRMLEQRDLVRYNAVKYGYQQQYKLGEAGNANFASFTFTGFEDTVQVGAASNPAHTHFGGEVTGGAYRFQPLTPSALDGAVSGLPVGTSPVLPHTGQYMLRLLAGNSASYRSVVSTSGQEEKGLQTGRIYRAAVWAHTSSSPACELKATVVVSGVTQTYSRSFGDPLNVTAGSWKLLMLDIPVPANAPNGSLMEVSVLMPPAGGQVSSSSVAYFDDLSIKPQDATGMGYVYDPATGWLLAELDNENFATLYTRDAAGRVTSVFKETRSGIKKVSDTQYHFAR